MLHPNADSIADHELLARFAAGDDDAFAKIVRRHRPLVQSVCARVLGRAADADDAAQLAFLALLRRATDFPREYSVAAWLQRTALYLALRLRACNQLRKTRETEAGELAVVPEVSVESAAEWQHTRSILLQEVHALPARYRLPLLLHYCEGLGQSEVAKQLGCSYGTVSGRLNRARALLRERLIGRGLALPVAMLAVLAPQVAAAGEMAEPQWHASVGIAARAELGAAGLSHVVTQLGAHIYVPVCMVLTFCWCASLFR